ncbi:PLD nuclease N-terminal domain-containing protein [Pseudalkalibacillus sp. Hm43]|uniref:PLD nuclease N-terminal domain-containing protein n=1 Tax=Pseudalkalibacillus sp. Hm43 TaxID=3450742 RepID=UPI003F43F990
MEELQMIRWDLVIPIIIIQLILIVVALVDLIRHKETNGPRWMWVLIILLVNLFGPILYFIFGRKQ